VLIVLLILLLMENTAEHFHRLLTVDVNEDTSIVF